jgi:hypothetical protein
VSDQIWLSVQITDCPSLDGREKPTLFSLGFAWSELFGTFGQLDVGDITLGGQNSIEANSPEALVYFASEQPRVKARYRATEEV